MNSKQKRYFYKWLFSGGLGTVLVGSGLCASIEVGFMRHEGASFIKWFLLGTVSLALIMAGLSFMIDALRWKIKLEKERKRGGID
jgi:hypothetical protein